MYNLNVNNRILLRDRMIYIFGDSHAESSFAGLRLKHENRHRYSFTMHRVGRDNSIPNFQEHINSRFNSFVFCFGEIDCRCHIGKQVLLGRDKVEICETIVSNYIRTILGSITSFRKIIVCAVPPPTNKEKHESRHGPIDHDLPFVGSDQERLENTQILNSILKTECEKNGIVFLDYTGEYSDETGCLIWEKSDKNVHIKYNQYIIRQLYKILNYPM